MFGVSHDRPTRKIAHKLNAPAMVRAAIAKEFA